MDEEEVNVKQEEVPVTEAPPKKKRILTEAQRLAFMKGREKRMMNLERKRQEKLEQEEVKTDPPIPDPPMPVLERQTNAEPKTTFQDDGIRELLIDIRDRLTPSPVPARAKRTYTRRAVEQPKIVEEEEEEAETNVPPRKILLWM
jgi:hypothetical protein